MSLPCVTVDCGALQNNYKKLVSLFPRSKIMVVIKADAYGHGMCEVAQALSFADAFAVSDVFELKKLRENNISNDIVVLCDVSSLEDMAYCIEQCAHVVIHSFYQLDMLRQLELNHSTHIIVKVNTGMNRLGFSPKNVEKVIKQLQDISQFISIAYMTHMACADKVDHQLTKHQIALLQSIVQDGQCWGVANSAMLINYSDIDANWIRPGLITYGVSSGELNYPDEWSLQPVMSFVAELIAINQVSKGSCIGYGADYVCGHDTLVGIVNAGYSHGYPQTASSETSVYLNGQYAHLVGRVSMNMLAINLLGMNNPQIGDEVELWGKHVSVEHVASHSNRISYELLCAVSNVRHSYV